MDSIAISFLKNHFVISSLNNRNFELKYTITIGYDILDATVAKFLHNATSRVYLNLSYDDMPYIVPVYMRVGGCGVIMYYHNAIQCTIIGGMSLSSH